MDPLSAGIGAAGDIAGGLITGAANAKEAEKNRHWQAMMAGSAHQRQVADMRAAGLNPILSGMGGSGASSGSGAQASMPDMSSIGSRAVQTGTASKAQKAQERGIDQNIKINEPNVTSAQQQQELLKGDFGPAFTEWKMLVDAGADPKWAAALTGLDKLRTDPDSVKEVTKKIFKQAGGRLKGEASSAYRYSGLKSTIDWFMKKSSGTKSQPSSGRRTRSQTQKNRR